MSPQGSILNKVEKRNQKRKEKAERKREDNQLIVDLKRIEPLTDIQEDFFESYDDGEEFIALIGSAGTGKSYCAIYKAIEEVFHKESERKKIILIRSAVQSREIGFIPGNEKEKTRAYEEPFRNIFFDLLNRDIFDKLVGAGKVEFITTSSIRGLTFDNAIIIVDEAQNMNFQELNTVTTRLGRDSRIIFCGDYKQNDLYRKDNDKSGLDKFIKIIHKMGGDVIEFTIDDIVRSELVKKYLKAVEEIEKER